MAVTQAQFDTMFTNVLQRNGFDLAKKDVKELLELVGDTVFEALQVEMKALAKTNGTNPAVTVRGIGKFTIRLNKARKGRNPATGEEIDIPASQKMYVKAPKALRDDLKVK